MCQTYYVLLLCGAQTTSCRKISKYMSPSLLIIILAVNIIIRLQKQSKVKAGNFSFKKSVVVKRYILARFVGLSDSVQGFLEVIIIPAYVNRSKYYLNQKL